MVTFGLSGSLQVARLLIGGLPLEFFQKLDCLFIDHSCQLVATDGCPEELCDKRLQPHCRWTQCVISLPFATQPLLLHFHRKTSAFLPLIHADTRIIGLPRHMVDPFARSIHIALDRTILPLRQSLRGRPSA